MDDKNVSDLIFLGNNKFSSRSTRRHQVHQSGDVHKTSGKELQITKL